MRNYPRFFTAIALTLAILLAAGLLPTASPTLAQVMAGDKGGTPILNEGFDATTFPPTNWTAVALVGTTYNWVRSTSGTNPSATPHNGSAGMVYYNSYSSPSGNQARLSTPVLNLTTLTNPVLQFWMYHSTIGSTYADSVYVDLSLDGGTSYTTTLGNFLRYTSTTSAWVLHTIDLSAYATQTNVKIGFRVYSNAGYNTFLDDVVVSNADPDYAVSTKTAVPAHLSSVSSGQLITYTVVVSNSTVTGTATLRDTFPYNVNYVPGSLAISNFGTPLASDAAGESIPGGAPVDLGNLYVTDIGPYLHIAFTVNADISGSNNWGKYALYIDTTNDSNGATSDAWTRKVTVADPHKPEFGIYTWVDNSPYSPSATQLWQWGGSSWSNIGSVDAVKLTTGPVSTIEWDVAKAKLGNPSQIWVEVWSTGGGTTDNAQDTINEPTADWNATDWSTTATLANSTAYTPSTTLVWSGQSLKNQPITVTYAVTPTILTGSVTNTATISDPTTAATVTMSTLHTVAAPNYNSSTILPHTIHPASLMTYTLVIYNSSAGAGTSTFVTSSIPAGTTYAGGAAVQGGGTLLADSGGITWTGRVTATSRVTITYPVIPPASGRLTVTAGISDVALSAPVLKTQSFTLQPPSGGPDAFGYTYQDSYASGGPTYSWVPTTTATQLVTRAGTLDQGWYTTTLPFNFVFYGNVYTTVYPTTNGLLTFGAGSSASTNTGIPTTTTPNNYIGCFWDDLTINIVATEGISYEVQGTAPNQVVIYSYAIENYAASGVPYVFQTLLFEGSNQIVCQYKSMGPNAYSDGSFATVGIENAAGTTGVQYSYNPAYGPIENKLAIRFLPPQRPMYDLSTKSVFPTGVVTPGDQLTYTVVVRNVGPVDGTMIFSDPIPAGATFVEALGDTLPTFDGTALNWTGTVTKGESITFTYVVNVIGHGSGMITNTATISDAQIPAPITRVTTNGVKIPAYSTSTKTVAPTGTVFPGQLLTYTVVLLNSGTFTGTATLSDVIPSGVNYVPGTAAVVGGGTLDDSNGIAWSGPVSVSGRVTVTYNALVTAIQGSITNTAVISDPLISASVSKSVNNSIAAPIYSGSSKSASTAGAVNPGQQLTYTIVLSNSGLLTGTATLDDPLPAEVSYVAASAAVVGGGTLTDTAGIAWSGSITPGGRITITYKVLVTGIRGTITNTATISDPLLLAPVAKSVANAIAVPVLSTSAKTVSVNAAPVGGTLTYWVAIKNTGSMTAQTASLVDVLPAGLMPNTGALAASSGSIIAAAGAVRWNGLVPPAATVYLTIPTTVGSDLCGQTIMSNTAVISDPALLASVPVTAAMVQIYGANVKFSEGFDEVTFPPTGWTTLVVTPSTGTDPAPAWSRVTAGTNPVASLYNGAGMLSFNSYNASDYAANRLSSPSFSLSGAGDAALVFAMYHDSGYSSSPDRIQVQISLDGGTVYTNVGAPIQRYSLTTGWLIHMVDLSAYKGQSVRLALLGISDYGNNMFVDLLSVRSCCDLPDGGDFTFAPPSPLTGQSIDFTGAVLTGTAPFTYSWDFGDGSAVATGNPATHSYAAAATYPVTMTVINRCGSTQTAKSVTVMDAPVAPVISLVSSSPTVLGNPTYFTGTLQTGSTPITYTWDFGDGTVLEAGLTMSHTYAAGSYTAILTASNVAGTVSQTVTVLVGTGPTAGFTPTSVTLNAPNTTAAFTSTSSNELGWLWNFGDGMTSTLQNPTHAYPTPAAQAANSYTVTLTVTNTYGTAQATGRVTITNYYPSFTGVSSGLFGLIQQGSLLTYTMRVTNSGKVTAAQASLVDTFPGGATGPAINVAASSGSIVANTASGLTWNGTLGVSESVTLTFVLTATGSCGSSVLSNTAVVSDPLTVTPLTLTTPGSGIYSYSYLSQGFDATTFPPTGWSTAVLTFTGDTAPAWSQATSGSNPTVSPRTGAGMLKFNSYSADAGDAARLVLPAQLPGVAVFQFAMYHDTGYTTTYDLVLVQISTDNGATYSTLANFRRYDGSTGWKLHSVDLTAYAGQSVRLALLGVSAYGNNMFLDDLFVGGCQSCAVPSGGNILASPDQPVIGQAVTFTGVVTGSAPMSYSWNFGDNGTGTGITATHTYTAARAYTVVMTATNSCGFAVYTKTVNVASSCVNVSGVDFNWTPVTPTAGVASFFTATLAAGTAPLTYTWNFGHGADVVDGATISHTFPVTAANQTYTVSLTVANGCSAAPAVVKAVTVAGATPVLDKYVFLPIVIRNSQ